MGYRSMNKTPYFTSAKFKGVCSETGKEIKVGDRIAYYPQTKKAYHDSSKQADELRGLEFNQSHQMGDANW